MQGKYYVENLQFFTLTELTKNLIRLFYPHHMYTGSYLDIRSQIKC